MPLTISKQVVLFFKRLSLSFWKRLNFLLTYPVFPYRYIALDFLYFHDFSLKSYQNTSKSDAFNKRVTFAMLSITVIYHEK